MSGLGEGKKSVAEVKDSAFLVQVEDVLRTWERSVRAAEVGKRNSATWDYWYINDAILEERFRQIALFKEAIDDSRLAKNESYIVTAYHKIWAQTKQWYLKDGLVSIGSLVGQYEKGEYPVQYSDHRVEELRYSRSVDTLMAERNLLREQVAKLRADMNSSSVQISGLLQRISELEKELEKAGFRKSPPPPPPPPPSPPPPPDEKGEDSLYFVYSSPIHQPVSKSLRNLASVNQRAPESIPEGRTPSLLCHEGC